MVKAVDLASRKSQYILGGNKMKRYSKSKEMIQSKKRGSTRLLTTGTLPICTCSCNYG